MTSERRLRSDVFLMFATKAIVMVLNIVTSVIVARALGPSGRGSVAAALALTMLLVQFGTLGMTTANTYFVAQDRQARGRIVSNSLAFAFGGGALLMGVGIVLKALAPSVARGLDWTELTLAVVAVPVMLSVLVLRAILLGERRTVAYNATELALSVATTVALFVVLVPLDGGVKAAIALTPASQLVAALVLLAVLREDGFRLPMPDPSFARETLRYAARVYVATLIGFALIRIDMLMVNGYLGARQAGIYSVAVALADGIYLIPTVIATNLFARVAGGLDTNSAAVVFRSVSVLYAGVVGVSVVFASLMVHVVYGSAYADATNLYYWLAPGVFSLGMINILSQYFAGRGFPKAAVVVWFPALAINLVINIIFIPRAGTYIASLASSIAYTFLLILHMELFARDTGGWRSLVPRPAEVVRFVRVAISPTVKERPA